MRSKGGRAHDKALKKHTLRRRDNLKYISYYKVAALCVRCLREPFYMTLKQNQWYFSRRPTPELTRAERQRQFTTRGSTMKSMLSRRRVE